MRYSFRLAERDRRLDGDEERGTPTRRRSRKRRCSYVAADATLAALNEAADHLNPEEKPAAANVVRFFDNGEKDVVKLIFSGRDAEPEEIVCTPEHRFYVIDRGWICAKDLQLGDCCLSANGERIAFLSRETLEEKQRVYNFEIQEKHTYYVNFIDKSSILVHNECSASDLKGLSPEVFEFYRQLFGKKGLLLLNGYLSGGNIIEAKDFWFASTKSSDGYWTGGLFNPTYNNHYRIQIDPDINPLESSLLLYEEVLKSRTSVYVYKYLDSTYLTEEFVKNRLGQLETLKAITHEAGDNLELLVSIANEPADWILSFNEFLDTGDVKPLLISGLPLVSGVMLKKIMGKLDFLRKVNIEYGCEEVAERVLKALDSIGIKGEVVKINIKPGISRIPGHTPTLGSVAGKTRMWTYHIVVIDRNMQMVYDVLTGPSGMKFDEYKKLFDNADIIDWKF